jgi:hypothetical protein
MYIVYEKLPPRPKRKSRLRQTYECTQAERSESWFSVSTFFTPLNQLGRIRSISFVCFNTVPQKMPCVSPNSRTGQKLENTSWMFFSESSSPSLLKWEREREVKIFTYVRLVHIDFSFIAYRWFLTPYTRRTLRKGLC